MSKKLLLLPLLISGLCLSTLSVMAQQVYRSTDAQGNVVFSDTPAEGSEAVNIDTPNIADSVETPPPSSEPKLEPAAEPEPTVTKKQKPTIQEEVDTETDYLRRRRYFYSDGDPRPRGR